MSTIRLNLSDNWEKIIQITVITSVFGFIWHLVHYNYLKKKMGVERHTQNNSFIFSGLVEFIIRMIRVAVYGYFAHALNVNLKKFKYF